MHSPALISDSRQASISVAVRVRPFTAEEEQKLVRTPSTPVFHGDGGFSGTRNEENDTKPNRNEPLGLRKIVNVVDDKMLIFDPPESNPLNTMQRRAFPNGQFRGRIRDYRFVFDRLFDESSTQDEVYAHTTKPLLDSVLDGYNATVFAYGATGCGKTHTISGSPETPGVIFLTMEELYKKIGLMSDTRLVDVSVSFLEIYNETIRDLLRPETPAKSLLLREDSAKRIVVANLSTHKPAAVADVMQLLVVGNRNRTSSPTEANAASSRSHAVLQINVTSHDRTANLSEEHTYATLSIIDLAGSERAAATKNRGVRLNEGANINKSLLALGNCINALCDPGRRNHVPYRDSKLTRLLKFSLGGNCKTVMIVCISPSSQHYDETLNTLKYADRAKEIKTKVIRNRQNLDRHVGSYLKMITEQKLEIEELRSREAKVLSVHAKKLKRNHAACLRAILTTVSGLRSTLDKDHHDKWRKYFSLAKRKLLILHLQDLDRITQHVSNNFHEPVSHSVRRFLIQAAQLQNKLNEQVISLETFYESDLSFEVMLGESVAHSLRKCQEMDGWGSAHTEMLHEMVESLSQRLQNDMLMNSSVLFDYLVSHVDEFSYLSDILCHTIEASQRYRAGTDSQSGNPSDDALDRATAVLGRMNDSDYDLALEAATSRFIETKDEFLNQMRFNNEAETPINSPRGAKKEVVIISPGGTSHKRISTSPLRDSPATKRSSKYSRARLNALPSGRAVAEESDLSMDDSTFLHKSDLEEDSPLSNRVSSSILDFDPNAYDRVLDSPPLKREDSETRGRLAGSRPRYPKSTNDAQSSLGNSDSLLRPSLLNTSASTIVANEADSAELQCLRASEDYTDANSSFMEP